MAYLLDAVDSFGENRTLARKHLNTLNCTEAHSLAGEIRGRLFWSKKTQYKHDHTRKQIAFFGWLLREMPSAFAMEVLSQSYQFLAQSFSAMVLFLEECFAMQPSFTPRQNGSPSISMAFQEWLG